MTSLVAPVSRINIAMITIRENGRFVRNKTSMFARWDDIVRVQYETYTKTIS